MFLKLILNIPKNYENYAMIILQLHIKKKSKDKSIIEYQLQVADLYNIPIDNVKKLVPNAFDKEKYVLHYENLQLYLRL